MIYKKLDSFNILIKLVIKFYNIFSNLVIEI